MELRVGSVEVGRRADPALWSPTFMGVKPDLVLLGGAIAAAPMGDPNASIPTPQPVHYRPMFGAFGVTRRATSVVFTIQAAIDAGIAERYSLTTTLVPVKNRRGGISKASMVLNSATPHREVDPETYEVRAGRRASDLRAGRGAAHGAALFLVLDYRYGRARPQVVKRVLRSGFLCLVEGTSAPVAIKELIRARLGKFGGGDQEFGGSGAKRDSEPTRRGLAPPFEVAVSAE